MSQISSKKIQKKLLGGKKSVKVAAVQVAQYVFDKEKSIEKACQYIKEAGRNGAELVAFSETNIPVFPAIYTGGFESDPDEWRRWQIGLQDNSIVIPSDDTEIIGKACREAGVYCVMGVNELEDTVGSRTMYNSQIMFGPDGKVLGRHRKLMPTYTEKTYWGMGDGSDLRVYDTAIGRIGSLICWEHHTILIRAAQMLMGEEIHIASWPGNWGLGDGTHLSNKNTNPLGEGCDLQFAIREYAFQSGAFVVSVSGYLREEDFADEYKDFINASHMNFTYCVGGSAIVDVFGGYLAEPVFEEETILYADLDPDDIKAKQAWFDGLGHYSRPDVVKLVLNTRANKNLIMTEKPDVFSNAYLREISETFEVQIEKLEALSANLDKKLSEG